MSLDKWTKEWVDLLDLVGNKVANDYYEYNVPRHIQKPRDNPKVQNLGASGDMLDPVVAKILETYIRLEKRE